jgi:hypothetical protein
LEFVVKALIAGCVVSFASWLAGRNPGLAGFLIALPVSTAVLLPMVYFDTGSYAQTLSVARSIAVAVPLTLLFFVPFFWGPGWGVGFWGVYAMAFGCLGGGFLIHRAVVKLVE